MANIQKNKTSWIVPVGIVALLSVIGFGIVKFINRNRTADANLASNDIDELSTAQAAKFFGLFGIERIGGLARATWVLKSDTLAKILSLAANIGNWSKVQQAFTALCGGSYTILQAASDALSASNYSTFVDTINKAVSLPMMYAAKGNAVAFSDVNNRSNAEHIEYSKGDYIGRCQETIGNYCKFQSWELCKIFYIEKQFVNNNANITL